MDKNNISENSFNLCQPTTAKPEFPAKKTASKRRKSLTTEERIAYYEKGLAKAKRKKASERSKLRMRARAILGKALAIYLKDESGQAVGRERMMNDLLNLVSLSDRKVVLKADILPSWASQLLKSKIEAEECVVFFGNTNSTNTR